MDKKEFYNMINRVIGDKVFQYEGPIMGGVSLDVVIDFKFKIVGDVKLLHMGEPKNHVSIDVTVLSITPPTLDGFIQNLDNAFEIKDRMYFTATKIENYIWRVLQHFSIEDTPVITSIKFTGKRYEYMEKINEGISEKKGIVRKVVQDIIRVFKKGEGEYALPEDIGNNMTYDFPNLNTEFTVEVKIDEDNTIEGFDIDGGYYDDEETFEIHIQYNPKFFPETYYDLIGELNEIVRHELQHLIQSERGINRPTDETDPEKYYLQPHELDAQIAGFKRLSKIRKEPFEKTVIDWFNKNKTLGDDAKERIINVILKTKKWPQ
jgi:hypothetical protein